MNHRQNVINQFVAWLGQGVRIKYLKYWSWQIRPTDTNPVPVAIGFGLFSGIKEFVLRGLLSAECDLLRRHLRDVEDSSDTAGVQEMCVVATLVTLFHREGMCLQGRTILHLHGKPVLFGQRVLDPPYFGRMWLHEYREEYGWDALVDFVAKQQQDIRYLGTGRRSRGRPRDEGFHDFARNRHERLKNVAKVAKEAAERYGITEEAAAKRIRRSAWYKQMTPARDIPKHKSAPRHPSLSHGKAVPGSPLTSPLDQITQFLRRHGATTSNKIASALGLEERFVKQILNHQRDRFQYLPGDHWEIW